LQTNAVSCRWLQTIDAFDFGGRGKTDRLTVKTIYRTRYCDAKGWVSAWAQTRVGSSALD